MKKPARWRAWWVRLSDRTDVSTGGVPQVDLFSSDFVGCLFTNSYADVDQLADGRVVAAKLPKRLEQGALT